MQHGSEWGQQLEIAWTPPKAFKFFPFILLFLNNLLQDLPFGAPHPGAITGFHRAWMVYNLWIWDLMPWVQPRKTWELRHVHWPSQNGVFCLRGGENGNLMFHPLPWVFFWGPRSFVLTNRHTVVPCHDDAFPWLQNHCCPSEYYVHCHSGCRYSIVLLMKRNLAPNKSKEYVAYLTRVYVSQGPGFLAGFLKHQQ